MDGIYTMANDTMAEFLRTFLISARKAMPDMPISIIPFDNSLSEVSKLASLYNAEILNPSLEWDSIGQKIYEKEEYRKGISSYRYFRKFNCFSGPYSHFCYLDANCIVLDFLNEIWNLCMTDEYDILFTSRSALSRSLSSYALREVLNIISPNLEGGYNCGFFMSKKGVIDIDNAQFLANTPNIRKLFGIAPEQAFLALYMSIKGLKHNLLSNINDTIQRGHRGDFRVSKGLDGKYHYEQGPGIGRRVYYMKWTGQNPNVLMSGVNSELVASILETDTSLEASPQLSSSNPRHIEHEQFHLFSNLTPYPDLLKDLAT